MSKLTKRSDGRYAAQVYIGKDANGKRKYKTVYGATIKEAQTKASDLKIALGKGINIEARKDTFEHWSEIWLNSKTCGEGQMSSYRACLKHLTPIFQMEIGKIRLSDIQPILNAKADKLSQKTLSQIRMTCRQIFNLAIHNRVIDYNPAQELVIPQKATPANTRKALSDEQIKWIQIVEHRAQLPAMIMLFCGLRRGEIMALRWSDIDLEEKTVNICKSVEMVNDKPIEKKGGKSDAATRIVPIPDILVEYLKRHEPKISSGLVTEKVSGGIHTTISWKRLWESYMSVLNYECGSFTDSNGKPASRYDPHGVPQAIEEFTAHQLRHTYATLLYEAGVDVLAAQKMLGHAKIETTLGIYTHLRDRHRDLEINKLNSYTSQIQVKTEAYTSENIDDWGDSVWYECLVRDQEAVGSSPTTPTTENA